MAKVRFGEITLGVESEKAKPTDMPMPDALAMIEKFKSSLDSNLQSIHENIHKLDQKIMNKKDVDLTEVFKQIDDLREQIHQVDEKKQPKIIQPEIKQTVIHKNHEDDIKELHDIISNIKPINKVEKVTEVVKVENKNQKTINIVLIVITALSLLLHIL